MKRVFRLVECVYTHTTMVMDTTTTKAQQSSFKRVQLMRYSSLPPFGS